jgi:oxalate/formate antiporter
MVKGGATLAKTVNRDRWTQLIAGIVCMVMIANLQYGWTLFVHPINVAHGWSIASIQVAFSIFVALETWLTPIEGWIVDRLGAKAGPKLMVAFGGVFIGLGWVVNSIAETLSMLYLGAVLAGIGGGAVYATCVGQAVKWFPDRRGLAVGLTAAGFGAGAALTVVPIREVIASSGYQAAFFWFGIAQGVIVFLLAWLLRAPEPGELAAAAAPKLVQSARSYTPGEVLVSPVFWVLYIMFVLVSASGLMATAQIALIARDFHVADTAILFGASALSVALIVDNVANGTARPMFGVLAARIDGNGAVGFRPVRGLDLPHLGRNLQSVSFNLHRQLRTEIRYGEFEPALYGQGSVGIPCAGRQHDQGVDRQLAHGVPRHRADEPRGSGDGFVCAQTDAVESRGDGNAGVRTRGLIAPAAE